MDTEDHLAMLAILKDAIFLRDLGIHAWRAHGICSLHDEIVTVIQTDGKEPTQRMIECAPCRIREVRKYVQVEAMERIG